MTRLELLRSHAITARQSRPPVAPSVESDALVWFVACSVLLLVGFVLAVPFLH